MKTGDLLKRRTPLLVTTGSEAGGEGTGAANGGGGVVAPRLLFFAKQAERGWDVGDRHRPGLGSVLVTRYSQGASPSACSLLPIQ